MLVIVAIVVIILTVLCTLQGMHMCKKGNLAIALLYEHLPYALSETA